jgi:tetratricopeptide (TPR) repeat protein
MSIPPSDDIDSQFAVAQALWERDEVARSEAILRELAARDPAREDVSSLLARLLQSQGRLDAASQVMFDLCRARAFDPEISLRGAQFIQQSHRQPRAAELCDLAIARGNALPALRAVAGNISRELGDFAKARALYLDALEAGVDLNTWFVLGALSHTVRYANAGHPDFARFDAHFRDQAFAARARPATGFGLAKAFDDIGDYESAARILRAANALVRSATTWSASGWDEFVDARVSDRVARVSAPTRRDFVPVFVVGLPRTGTTLAATRLAQHTAARDRGELRMLRFIAEQLIGGRHLGDAGAIAEAAELYRVHARQDDAPAIWYIDQDPLNFRYLHIIEALFPQARVIHCRRGRRDTALSVWFQDFAHHDSAFAYDFAYIARFATGHDRLMRHWRRTLSLPIYTLDYEALIADPASTLDSLLDFIGAPAADAAASPAAPIHSASVWQARQPIYSGSVGRWRKYAPFVPELIELFPEASA